MSLSKVYYDPKHTAGFSSATKLVSATKSNKRNVEEWLSGQDTYTLHERVRKRFPRNPYTVTNINDIWEMHLADLSFLSRYNDKYKYLLNIIDVFSRYARSVSLKDKTGQLIAAGLTTLFQNRKPTTLQSDKGTEFVNSTVQQYLKRQGVDFHTTHNPDINRAVIERFNRTLKTKMCKYFSTNNTYRHLDIINELLASYNSVHSTIGMTPNKVSPSNIHSVWQKVNSLRTKLPHGRVKCKVGDLVRITKQKVVIAKGYKHFKHVYFEL